MRFNRLEVTTRALESYQKDVLSYFPTTTDDYFGNQMLDWDKHEVGLLYFRRDETGEIDGLTWRWDRWEEPTFFKKDGKDST